MHQILSGNQDGNLHCDISFLCCAGGCLEEVEAWKERLRDVTKDYGKVLFLGDSMGATAALLFSEYATNVQAFCPQVLKPMCSVNA